MTFRTPYDGKRHRVALSFVDDDGVQLVGRTKQCHKNECNINRILSNYDKQGLITHVNNAKAEYGDFTEVNEYQQSLNMVMEAQSTFDDLPADIRKKFGNDPGNFFEFVTNPDNKDEMISLGLAVAPLVEEPMLVKMVDSEPQTEA